MKIIHAIFLTLPLLGACTLAISPDAQRISRIEEAVATKADAQVVGQNFKILADQVNALKQAAQPAPPAK